jgi:DNA-binding GntR family transcriptional regulator
MRTQSFRHSESLSIKVANYLRRSIVQGEFLPGERLNELLISTRLSISRSPVREAFRILESENLVDIHSRRGAFVKRLSYKEVEEFFTVLSMIEITAIRLAVNNMNANSKKELKFIIQQLEKCLATNDIEKYKNVSMRLHYFVIRATGNSLFVRLHNYLAPQRERLGRIIFMDQNNTVKSMKEHLAISKALLRSDGEKAELLLKNHIGEGTKRVLKSERKGNGD